MANPTNKLTVSDLETAKAMFENRVESAMADIFHRGKTGESRFGQDTASYAIAATCIGIVEEMVKLNRNLHDGLEKWTVEGGWRDRDGEIPDELAQINTEKFGCISNLKEGMMRKTDCDHIVSLHNLWLKAVAAFGGEVKILAIKEGKE